MILFTKDSGGVVASVAALIATGWSDPLPGGLQLPLKNNAFSRRTGFAEAWTQASAGRFVEGRAAVLSGIKLRTQPKLIRFNRRRGGSWPGLHFISGPWNTCLCKSHGPTGAAVVVFLCCEVREHS